jgi:antitoxin (DNA-binding transcriptional repressor) of toxin-antitoxin stability system
MELRTDTKNILDGTRFLDHRYIVTRNGIPTAQIVPPSPSDEQDPPDITVTDLRMKTREILDAVSQGKTFLILRYGRADALFCPLSPTTLLNEVPKEESSPVVSVTRDTDGGGVHPSEE